MRLRYLHLPRYGPLNDVAIVFGREDSISNYIYPPRKGALNFIVGVNGSGKSSILRIIYRTFRSLNMSADLPVPLTLAWDYEENSGSKTTVLHYSNLLNTRSYLALISRIPDNTNHLEWSSLAHALGNEFAHPLVANTEIQFGPGALRGSLLFARLPKRIIAYTSGASDPWDRIEHPSFDPRSGEPDHYEREDERSQGWDISSEVNWRKKECISALLKRFDKNTSGKEFLHPLPASQLSPGNEFEEILTPYLQSIQISQNKREMMHVPRNERMEDFYFRIDQRQMRYAGITMSLWQAALELAGKSNYLDMKGLRAKLRNGTNSYSNENFRRVLNEIDWFYPTHLSITYKDQDERITKKQHEELACLVALADEVMAQPQACQRAVVSLGHFENLSLSEKFLNVIPYTFPNSEVERIVKRIDGCKTGAEAILRLFCEDKNLDSTPLDFFARLRDWERTGLLKEITLTIKRIRQTGVSDDNDDPDEGEDVIVTFDQLSDGEQMLLGRMGLLFLLRGQDGSLLLLDEPETHFNDVWKREIVGMVDSGLLNTTEANVIVATHTSIALTDAFAAEVTVLDKNTNTGETSARSVSGGLFGTDPGEVNMNLFHADSSIGSRSLRILDQLLRKDWKGHETELEEILKALGSSFHRAELRALLKQLKSNSNGTAQS